MGQDLEIIVLINRRTARASSQSMKGEGMEKEAWPGLVGG